MLTTCGAHDGNWKSCKMGRVQNFMLILGQIGLGYFTCGLGWVGRVKKIGPTSNSALTLLLHKRFCYLSAGVELFLVQRVTLYRYLLPRDCFVIMQHNETSSPAVAERPRDASCLSVVSFKNTLRRAQPLHTIKFCSVLFSSSWSSMLAVINKIHWRVTVCAVNCTLHSRSCCWHSINKISELEALRNALYKFKTYLLTYLLTPPVIDPIAKIFVENRDLCLSHLLSEYCHDVWCGKTRMVWLPDNEKFWRYSFLQNTWRWQTDGLTDGRTDRHRTTA